ncbi:DNA alkylation repair protein [Corallincola platygyrae]|uniref:DNA alkylation repair protein n=1 Tax=Corallincola platygyrae TaxID=1193278 RepID=A0ABW4XIV0_9GAMM
MLMKDGLGPDAIRRISTALKQIMTNFSLAQFDVERFERDALTGLEPLELKQRLQHLITVLNQHLPEDFAETAVLLKKLPEVWDRGDPDDPIRGFAIWPLTDYVAEHGLEEPQLALDVMAKLTPLFSAEFAIRPFIEQHPELTFKQLEAWLQHPDEHIRRLVSEGTRPRLPWGMQLKGFIQDPSPILPLLQQLRFDDSLYVRRSVANNLNDISKDHPEVVIALCKQWKADKHKDVDWIIGHATRTLVKAGHPRVFSLLGYSDNPAVKVSELNLETSQVSKGDTLPFSVTFSASEPQQKFVADYAVHYMKANGKTAAKVFKLKNLTLNKGEAATLEKQISFKEITTRKFYPGTHKLAIHINGIEQQSVEFELE